jgi:HEAT repeat protein
MVINEFLADSRPRIQSAILAVLGSRGINASKAVPILIPFLTNSVLSVRERASNTLLRIAPSQAVEYGVRTNQSALRSMQ